MSLALIPLALVTATAPTHSIDIHHSGANHAVEYRGVIETDAKIRRTGAPTRAHSTRCELTATVSVERHIMMGASTPALTSTIAPTKVLEQTAYGPCANAAERLERLVAAHHGKILKFLASAAEADRPSALAAIEAVRSLAVN